MALLGLQHFVYCTLIPPTMTPRIGRTKLGGLAALMLAVACDTAQAPPAQSPQPTFITEGTKVRLNLLTPQARARVALKDPIQGVKNARGGCEFRPDAGTMRKSPLSAVVGEYDTETCAGLLYYFPPNPRPHPRPTWEDTTVLVAPGVPRS
jgi:hypothetical protein